MPYADPETKKTYHRKYMREYIRSLTPKQLESKRAARERWAKRNPDHGKQYYHANKHIWRANNLKKLYGLSLADYAAMLLRQGGCCAICGTGSPGRGRTQFSVDHCHTTGAVRGLLCSPCNSRLGVMEKWYLGHKDKIHGYIGRAL